MVPLRRMLEHAYAALTLDAYSDLFNNDLDTVGPQHITRRLRRVMCTSCAASMDLAPTGQQKAPHLRKQARS
ncbi:hypothetical protein ACLTEW_23490 [Gordonia lacunae]|uniref:hypothetical protein n=1 Tax=Gordonia lacunae TaxID=417102 RepID=UPI0039E2C034